MDSQKMTAREALDQLPGRLRLVQGCLRVAARFSDGKLVDPVRITTFRVPPRAIESVERGLIERDLLEFVARELKLHVGETELVVEYEPGGHAAVHGGNGDGRPRLHWIDMSWHE